MKRYLDRDGINELTEYLDKYLPKSDRQFFKKINTEVNGLFFKARDEYRREYWQFMWSQLVRTRPDLYQQITRFKRVDANLHIAEEKKVFDQFIKDNYQREWKHLQSEYSQAGVQYYLDGFCKVNIVDGLNPVEILDIKNTRDYIESRYSKHNIDKDCLKFTDRVKTAIDNYYNGIDYDTFQKITKIYIRSRDERILHNMLNSNGDISQLHY